MQLIDIIIIVFLIYGFYTGFCNGFFYELASFVSIALGIYMAIYFSDWVRIKLEDVFDYHNSHINIISFVITLVGTVIGVRFLARFLATFAGVLSLGILNKVAGGFFSTMKTLLLLSIVLNLFLKLNKRGGILSHKKVAESTTVIPIVEASQDIYPMLEVWFPEVMEIKEEFKKAL
jgi:membrane protein required for colicin V production